MFELNRLKPMPEVYDHQLFNKLYQKTEGLRKKLASQIDPHRFGVTYEDILSSFDIKFIFVFSKCHKEPENILLATILNSMQNFKCRILRAAYTKKYSQNIMQIDDLTYFGNTLTEDHPQNKLDEHYSEKLMEFMKGYLSPNALAVFEVKLNPPPYIQNKLNTHEDANLQKIPDDLILDYFDLGFGIKAHKYLNSLKKEIVKGIKEAKNHFNQINYLANTK